LADLLVIQDANPFRVRAYRNAVPFVDSHGVPMRGPRVAPLAPINRCEGCLFVLVIIVNQESEGRWDRCCGQRTLSYAEPFTQSGPDYRNLAGSGSRCLHPALEWSFLFTDRARASRNERGWQFLLIEQ
jgi:hypothetical protein